jgi:hypothetical protein
MSKADKLELQGPIFVHPERTMFVALLGPDDSVIAAIPLAGDVREPFHIEHAILRAQEYAAHYARTTRVHTVLVSTGSTGDWFTEYGTVYEEVDGVVLVDYRRGDGIANAEGMHGPWPCYKNGTPYKFA